LRPVRVGFTVSRRVGNAVSRNRVRRRLRSAVDEVLPLYAREGRDYVIIGRAATLKRPYNSLLNDLTVALKRLGASRAGEETRGRPRRTDNEPGT
jgi:ribonuclease P protein component